MQEIKKIITLDDLKGVETDIAKSIFGKDIEYKFLVDSFPLQIVSWNGY